MARKRRRQRAEPTAPLGASGAAALPSAYTDAPARSLRPDWRWRSFPTFFAFVCGMLLAFLVNEGTANPVAFILLIASLLGVGYGLAHMFITNVVVASRVRARQRAAADDGDGSADSAEYEDVLVYDEDSDSDGDETGAPSATADAP
jgi:hypothetical protein